MLNLIRQPSTPIVPNIPSGNETCRSDRNNRTSTIHLKRKRNIQDEMGRNVSTSLQSCRHYHVLSLEVQQQQQEDETCQHSLGWSSSILANLTPMARKTWTSVAALFTPTLTPPSAITSTRSSQQRNTTKRLQLQVDGKALSNTEPGSKPDQIPGTYPLSPTITGHDESDIRIGPHDGLSKSSPIQSLQSSSYQCVRNDKWNRIIGDVRPASTLVGRPGHIPPKPITPRKTQAVLRAEQKARVRKRFHQSENKTRAQKKFRGTEASETSDSPKRYQHRNLGNSAVDGQETGVLPESKYQFPHARNLVDFAAMIEDLPLDVIIRNMRLASAPGDQPSTTASKKKDRTELWQRIIAAIETYKEKDEHGEEGKPEELSTKLGKKLSKKVIPSRDFVRAPSKEVTEAMPDVSSRGAHEALRVYGKTPVKPHDLQSVKPGRWLNDNIINAWFDDLCRHSRTKFEAVMRAKGRSTTDNVPRYHAFNTNWYPTACKPDGIAAVARWAKRAKLGGINLLKGHKILIPCHANGNHWTLLAILPQRRLVRYYDSLHGSAGPYLDIAQSWIAHELSSIDAWDEAEWTFEAAESSSQQNGSDCGVFASFNALATFYSENTSMIVPSEVMNQARQIMEAVLLSGGFIGEFDLEAWYPGFRLEDDRGVVNGTS